MSALSDEAIEIVIEALTEFGQSVPFVRETEGSYSVSTGTTGAATVTNFSNLCVPDEYNIREIDGINVLATDVRLYCAPTNEPLIGDEVTLNSVKYRVQSIKPTAVNSINVLYELQIRK